LPVEKTIAMLKNINENIKLSTDPLMHWWVLFCLAGTQFTSQGFYFLLNFSDQAYIPGRLLSAVSAVAPAC
jgi:hypothetical protein